MRYLMILTLTLTQAACGPTVAPVECAPILVCDTMVDVAGCRYFYDLAVVDYIHDGNHGINPDSLEAVTGYAQGLADSEEGTACLSWQHPMP